MRYHCLVGIGLAAAVLSLASVAGAQELVFINTTRGDVVWSVDGATPILTPKRKSATTPATPGAHKLKVDFPKMGLGLVVNADLKHENLVVQGDHSYWCFSAEILNAGMAFPMASAMSREDCAKATRPKG